MTHSFLIGVVLVLFFSSVPWILPGFSTRICYQTDLASGEWKNESASLAEHVEKLLMLSRAVDVLCTTSNFNSTSTLFQLHFYKLKLAIIYLRISKLNCDWLIQRFWDKTKNKEIALVCGKRRFGLGQKMVKIISTTYNLIGIAVSAVPKSHAHVLTLGKLALLFINPNQQIL